MSTSAQSGAPPALPAKKRDPAKPDPTKPDPDPKKGLTMRDGFAIAVGVVALIGYLVTTVFLWNHVGAVDMAWGRYLGLYDGVRSIALAAAGFFFGAKVNLDRADKAEKKADKVEADKVEASASKAGAMTTVDGLATTIRQLRDRNSSQPSPEEVLERYLGHADHVDSVVPGYKDFVATKTAARAALGPSGESDWDLLARIADEQLGKLRAAQSP